MWLGSLHGGALKLLHAVGLGGARPPNAFWYIFRLSGCRFWQTFLCNLSLIFIYWGRRNFAGVSNIMSVLSRECMASLVCVCVCVCTLQPAAYSLVCKGRRESRDSTAQFSSPSPGGRGDTTPFSTSCWPSDVVTHPCIHSSCIQSSDLLTNKRRGHDGRP